MNEYVIEKMDLNNAEYFAKVSSLAWFQSYKKIVDLEYLKKINTEEEIEKTVTNLIDRLSDGKRFLLKYHDEYVGILRVRKTKYEKYNNCGELGALYLLDKVKGKGFGKILLNYAKEELKSMGYNSMIVGCLQGNKANNFYLHMGGKLIDTNPLTLPNNQELIENLYYFDI